MYRGVYGPFMVFEAMERIKKSADFAGAAVQKFGELANAESSQVHDDADRYRKFVQMYDITGTSIPGVTMPVKVLRSLGGPYVVAVAYFAVWEPVVYYSRVSEDGTFVNPYGQLIADHCSTNWHAEPCKIPDGVMAELLEDFDGISDGQYAKMSILGDSTDRPAKEFTDEEQLDSVHGL